MKVLFLMFAFPDMNKSFNMFTTLVEEFVINKNEVVVIAPGRDVTGMRKENHIDVLRVKTLPIKNVSNYIKGISNLLLPFQFQNALNICYPNTKFDLIISSTPPITLAGLTAKLKRKHKAKFYLILRDIFPQNAVDLGFIREGSILHHFFRNKEKKLYQEADFIGCMSEGNVEYVLKHNPSLNRNKLHELKNFQKLYADFENDHSNLKKKFGIEGKFVVVFGGNMGKPQQLENVLQLANSCQKYSDVLFLLLGEGIQAKKLAVKIKDMKVSNIRIQGTIPKQEYQDLLSVCDLGLISLHENFTIPNIPSKTLDYFNVGLPVLASIDKATDYSKVLKQAQAGLWSYAGDHEQLMENFEILYLNKNLRECMGINGRDYFKRFLTPDIAYQKILDQFNANG